MMELITETCWSQALQSRILAGNSLAEAAVPLSSEREWFLVYDQAVEPLADVISTERCPSVISTERSEWRDLPALKGRFPLSVSEGAKTLETVWQICRAMMEAGLSREGLVVALGGGITTDLAGFAASIYKRGVRYATVPTTLLAQVDAAIGGKTGVNLDGCKNMLGAFSLPEWVYLCPEVLQTLPPREFRCGLAELVKTFLVADADCYAELVSGKSPVFPDSLAGWVRQAARIKAEIVSRDFRDCGERRKLNLGHTFAHAIETVALERGDDIHHGEAVAMGIILAARLGDALGVSSCLADRLAADLRALGLPVESPYPVDALLPAMERDKKADGEGSIRFILLRRIGEAEERPLLPEDIIKYL